MDAEIVSWTFLDHASFSPASYAALTLRCLKAMGWRLDHQDREHFVLLHDRRRVVVRFEWTDRDLECLAVHEVATAAQHNSCQAACVITNGRFSGAASAMAAEFGVVALHCSQLDLLTPQRAPAPMIRPTSRSDLPLAA
ncbi:restriction endonuclease [Methylobacterium sp. J-077]|uniref:restriction endonuclease n=1 Tax=Methylobacterium sp. J-077 TaxID=2836656 RepID=UPI001FB9D0E5|nr:restriction endonuclease [Methylobacterium sp. J-077]MCJ2123141.1 restriction endonuclease [Methylobacterium sp. J-077]